MVKITEYKGMFCIPVKVSPGASRNEILGVWEDSVKISVNAPPEKGKANQELCHFLAKSLQYRKSDVVVVQGEQSRNKLIAFIHCNRKELEEKIQTILNQKGVGSSPV